jgi:hypothetical protein
MLTCGYWSQLMLICGSWSHSRSQLMLTFGYWSQLMLTCGSWSQLMLTFGYWSQLMLTCGYWSHSRSQLMLVMRTISCYREHTLWFQSLDLQRKRFPASLRKKILRTRSKKAFFDHNPSAFVSISGCVFPNPNVGLWRHYDSSSFFWPTAIGYTLNDWFLWNSAWKSLWTILFCRNNVESDTCLVRTPAEGRGQASASPLWALKKKV